MQQGYMMQPSPSSCFFCTCLQIPFHTSYIFLIFGLSFHHNFFVFFFILMKIMDIGYLLVETWST